MLMTNLGEFILYKLKFCEIIKFEKFLLFDFERNFLTFLFLEEPSNIRSNIIIIVIRLKKLKNHTFT